MGRFSRGQSYHLSHKVYLCYNSILTVERRTILKLAIDRNILLSAVQSVFGAVARKSSLPVLQFLHIKGDGQQITVTATDLETTLISRFENHDLPFESLLPAKRLLDVLRAFPDDAVVGLEDKDSKATVKCGRSRFSLVTGDPAEFPVFPESEFYHQFFMPMNLLKSLMDYVDYATAQQDVRYYLNGVLMELSHEGHFNLVATDGHRLAKVSTTHSTNYGGEVTKQVIIPKSSMMELKKLLKGEEDCELCFAKNHVRVNLPHSTFITKLIDGQFPDYNRVIPRQRKTEATFHREQLLSAIGRIALIKDDKTSGIELNFGDNLFTVRSRNSSQEEGEEQIDIEYVGSLVFGMNASYLMDVLRAIQSEKVMLRMNDNVDPLLIEGVETDQGLHVVMGMRL